MSTIRDRGSAVIPAIIFSSCAMLLALSVVMDLRTKNSELKFQVRRTRASAAADAAYATIAEGLYDRQSAYGAYRQDGDLELEGFSVRFSVYDLAGRVPINSISQEQAERLFEISGLGPSEAIQDASRLMEARGTSPGIAGLNDEDADQRGFVLSSARINSIDQLARMLTLDNHERDSIASNINLYGDRFNPNYSSSDSYYVMDGLRNQSQLTRYVVDMSNPDPLLLHLELSNDRSIVLTRQYVFKITNSPLRPVLELGRRDE